MLTRKHTIAAALAAALLLPTLASADQPSAGTVWRFVGGEAGWIFESKPSRLTRDEVLRATTDPIGAVDVWRFVGGEAGWTLEPARLKLVNGLLAHADECLFDPAKSGPAKDTGPVDPLLHIGA